MSIESSAMSKERKNLQRKLLRKFPQYYTENSNGNAEICSRTVTEDGYRTTTMRLYMNRRSFLFHNWRKNHSGQIIITVGQRDKAFYNMTKNTTLTLSFEEFNILADIVKAFEKEYNQEYEEMLKLKNDKVENS